MGILVTHGPTESNWGGVAEGTLQAVVARTTLAPYPVELKSGKDHVERLSRALAAHAEKRAEA